VYNFNFTTTPSRFGLFQRCMRSEMGEEPRDPHANLPPSRLPRWDPANPYYDPNAPYDTFPKRLKAYVPKEPKSDE
jgi:hypothetical protein